jgi:hypothetical protein
MGKSDAHSEENSSAPAFLPLREHIFSRVSSTCLTASRYAARIAMPPRTLTSAIPARSLLERLPMRTVDHKVGLTPGQRKIAQWIRPGSDGTAFLVTGGKGSEEARPLSKSSTT